MGYGRDQERWTVSRAARRYSACALLGPVTECFGQSRHLCQLHLSQLQDPFLHHTRLPRSSRHLSKLSCSRRRLLRYDEPEQPNPNLQHQHHVRQAHSRRRPTKHRWQISHRTSIDRRVDRSFTYALAEGSFRSLFERFVAQFIGATEPSNGSCLEGSGGIVQD